MTPSCTVYKRGTLLSALGGLTVSHHLGAQRGVTGFVSVRDPNPSHHLFWLLCGLTAGCLAGWLVCRQA